MKFKVSKETSMSGGWTGYLAIFDDEKQIFEDAIAGYNGVEYSPLYVTSQVVFNGTNYRFKCVASLLDSDIAWEAIIEVYKPIKGKSYIINITKI